MLKIVSSFQTNELFEAFNNGIAIYETIRFFNDKPVAISEHYTRLCKSFKYIRCEPPSFEEFEKTVYENKTSGRLKIVYIRADKVYSYVSIESTESFFVDTVKIDFTPVRRAEKESIPPDLKILNRPDIYLARLTKKDNYDVVMLGSKGQVCEGTFSNIFLVYKDKIVTPSLESGILDGITRMQVISFLKEIGHKVEERFVEPQELFLAEEVFLTHTSRGIVPVDYISTHKTRSVEFSQKLSKRFEEYLL